MTDALIVNLPAKKDRITAIFNSEDYFHKGMDDINNGLYHV